MPGGTAWRIDPRCAPANAHRGRAHEPAGQRSHQRAGVQRAGGRRCEPADVLRRFNRRDARAAPSAVGVASCFSHRSARPSAARSRRPLAASAPSVAPVWSAFGRSMRRAIQVPGLKRGTHHRLGIGRSPGCAVASILSRLAGDGEHVLAVQVHRQRRQAVRAFVGHRSAVQQQRIGDRPSSTPANGCRWRD